jgi:hypothetical protein
MVKPRKYKNLYCYYNNSNILFKEYRGPSDAAAQLKIGQCTLPNNGIVRGTVHRHINNKKPLNLPFRLTSSSLEVNDKPLIFTYTKID